MQSTVLLLDDEPTVRQSLGRYLELYGFRVVQAGTVQEGLTQARLETFDAYVLDVRLPDSGSGLDVLSFIRQHEQSATRPVFVLTGNVLGEEEEHIIRRDSAYVFYKPHGYAELVGKLQQACVGAEQCA